MGQQSADDLRDAYRMYAAQGNVTGQERTAKQLAAIGGSVPRAAVAEQRKQAAEPAPQPEQPAAEQPPARREPPRGRTTAQDRQAKT